MKVHFLLLTLLFLGSVSYSQENKSSQAYTNVYHNLNNISMTNFDGTRSTIYVNRNSATLDNSDGTSSTINFFGDHSNLIWTDGTQSSVFHNGSSSRINNPGGKQFIISHRKNRSSFLTTDGAHAITHFFGNIKECRYIDKIDVLIHMNWLVQKKAANAALNKIGTIE